MLDTLKFSAEQLHKILVGGNYLSAEDFKKIASKSEQGEVVKNLIAGGFLTKDLWGQAVAEFYDVPYADLGAKPPKQDLVMLLPKDIAQKYRLVVSGANQSHLAVATDQIQNAEEIVQKLRTLTGLPTVSVSYTLSQYIDEALLFYEKPLQERLNDIIATESDIIPTMLREIFNEAKVQHASDIHFEPDDKNEEVRIRLRIDGVLNSMAIIKLDLYDQILNRLKVISNLRIDEHRSIQDGALRFETDKFDFEVRVSIAPTVSGEKVTLRILSEYIEAFTPESLGMSADQIEILKQGVRRPYGMIVVSGPTGSGKSTTAYTLLNDVSDESINITTIEDPVEYQMTGINQIQVHADQGISFANGLRSIVRQDPDIIYVGEIRDNETAEISVNAALTGHLLFTTFHANSASTTAPRLLEMDIEPYLLASTLSLVVAQRLVRKLCVSCRYSEEISKTALKKILKKPATYFEDGEATLYKSKGCAACNNTGFRGRTVITEILEVDEAIGKLIANKATAKEIEKAAIKSGMKSLFVDGISKVKLGITSLEELIRVVEEPK